MSGPDATPLAELVAREIAGEAADGPAGSDPDADPEADPEAGQESDSEPGLADGVRRPIPFTPADLKERHGKPGGVLLTGFARLPRGVRAAWKREASTAGLLDRDWTASAESIAALGHPVRLALLREVLRGTRSIAALTTLPGLGSSGQLYHHMKPLLAEGWLQPAGRGRYEVPEARVVPLLAMIATIDR